MSKELTEKLKNGELPCGAYYVNRLGETRIYLVRYEDNKNTHEIYEVLAPVPSYEELQKLKEQLGIATKALKEISRCYSKEYNKAGEISYAALKEMEGVK